MNTKHDQLRRSVPKYIALAVAASMAPQLAYAGVDISTAPLLTSSAVAPNIMFMLDDSGSMQWEIMPDSITFYEHLFPRPRDNQALTGNTGQKVYGASDYGNSVPNFHDTNWRNFKLRSPHNNLVFYNPTINYQPWRTFANGASVKVTGDAAGNVDPHNAPYNPYATNRGDLDLDPPGNNGVSMFANWQGNNGDACRGQENCNFWPITFYIYNGAGSVDTQGNYTRYQVRNSRAYRWNMGAGAESEITDQGFTWTNADGETFTRTTAEEIQNFANWFSYYRSRLLAARGGASLAFTTLGENYRVGFSTINHKGEATYTYGIDTAADFSGSDRAGWFDKLLGVNVSTNGTPLRSALKWTGDYYAGDIDGNKWAPSDEAACRRSFTILTTDGYWNGPDPAVGNTDGTDGATYTSDLPEGGTGGYVAGPPYEDGYSNTLADVAMKYWKTDLDAAPNKVKPTAEDPNAFWQHMNTFTLSIGLQGTLDPSEGLADDFASWPDPFSGSADRKIDDLWHAAVNGRGQFVPAKNPTEFADGLAAALKAISNVAGSASSLSGNTTSLSTDSMVFQARYVAGVWSGDLRAWQLNSDTGEVIAGTDADGNLAPHWSASKQLDLIAPATRDIWTTLPDGTKTQFVSTNAAVVAALGNGGSAAVVNYLRGVRTGEGAGVTEFRQRTTALGDIVNSTPAYAAAPPNMLWERTAIAGAGSYQAFRSNNSGRAKRVFVGANDGMLHAFDANNGNEVFAYIPSTLLGKLAELKEQDYAHDFYVDGDVTVEDIYDGSGWRSILVASLGRGGRLLFALDVTTPANAFGAANILWEKSGADVAQLGHVLSPPLIAPLNNNAWGVIVGNGYNSDDDRAHLVILNALTGALIKTLPTDAETSNGLAGAGGWDDDGDGDVDLIYAGDLKGRLWKFDVSTAATADWVTANNGDPLFQASRANVAQPITAPPAVGRHPDTGELWVFFGTGRFISGSDRSDTSIQTWYGIRDKIADDVAGNSVPDRSDLAERVIKEQGYYTNTGASRADGEPLEAGETISGQYRLVSDPMDGEGATGAEELVASDGTYIKHGWHLDLVVAGSPGNGERMLVRNTLLKNVLLGETLTPNTAPCGELGDGWLMAINPWFGGRPVKDFFDVNGDKKVDEGDRIHDETVSGWKKGNGGRPFIQRCKDGLCITSSSTDGDAAPETVHAKDDAVRGRLSWRELLEN